MKKKLLATVSSFMLAGSVVTPSLTAQPVLFKPQLDPIGSLKTPSPKVLNALAAQLLIKKVADNIETRLKGKSVGYEFVVTHNDTLSEARAAGAARRAPDANPRTLTAEDKFNIASVSKTITAAALLKLLHQKNISVDTPMYSYLPSDWKLGNNIKSITFRELLTHRAGLRCQKEVTYNFLKECIANGINLNDKKTWQYNNSNFALFRMIIPKLFVGNVAIPTGETPSSFYAKTYISYVQRHIFLPAGLGTNIFTKPTDANPALTYQFPSPIIKGESFGDMTETNASRGWNMSAKQLSVFMSRLMFTEKILPQAVREQMKNENLGLYAGKTTNDILDYQHGGYYPGKNDKGELYNNGELNSLIIGFSNGVTVSLIVNSQLGPGLSPANEVKTAMFEALK